MYERIYIYIEQSVTYLAFEETRKLHKNYSIIFFFTHRRERRGDSLHVAT